MARWTGIVALAAASGVLLAWTFPPHERVGLLWVALLPVCWLIDAPTVTVARVVAAFVGSLVFHLTGLGWLRNCYHVDQLFSEKAGAWLLTSELFALVFTTCVILANRYRLLGSWPMAVRLCLFVGLFEQARWHAGGVVSGQPFPWLSIGLPVVQDPRLSQVAEIGGLYALSLIPAFVNGCLWDAMRRWQIRPRLPMSRILSPVLWAAAVLMGLSLYGWQRARSLRISDGPRVCIAHVTWGSTTGGGAMRLDLAAIRNALAPYSSEQPAIYLFPEQVYPFFVFHSPSREFPDEFRKDLAVSLHPAIGTERIPLEELARALDAVVAIGCNTIEMANGEIERYNSILYFAKDGCLSGRYDKRRLVPWQEWHPHRQRGKSLRGMSFVPGRRRPQVVCEVSPGQSLRFGSLICYDIAFPDVCVESVYGDDRASDLIVCAASEPMTTGNALQKTCRWMARARAIECRRSVARSVRGGWSQIVEPDGFERVVEHSGATFCADTVLCSERTLYSRAPWLGTIILVAFLTVNFSAYLAGRKEYRC